MKRLRFLLALLTTCTGTTEIRDLPVDQCNYPQPNGLVLIAPCK